MDKLTENFTLEELYQSPTACRWKIDNTPSEEVIEHLKELCEKILQPLRDVMNRVSINSGYRCEALNKKVKGSNTSQHVFGNAVDIKTVDMKAAFIYIMENLPFDQLIWEYGDDNQPAWIHVSYSDRNRREVLRKKTRGGYKPFKIKTK